jgi:hypothetical protein
VVDEKLRTTLRQFNLSFLHPSLLSSCVSACFVSRRTDAEALKAKVDKTAIIGMHKLLDTGQYEKSR